MSTDRGVMSMDCGSDSDAPEELTATEGIQQYEELAEIFQTKNEIRSKVEAIESKDAGPSDLYKPTAQVYIVHVTRPENVVSAEERESWHKSFLPSTNLSSGEPRLVYSYDQIISGFAAWLTAEEVKAMESKDGFLGAYPSEEYVSDTFDDFND